MTQADDLGFATVRPAASHSNFVTIGLANAFTAGLGPAGQLGVAASTPTRMIVDFAGCIL